MTPARFFGVTVVFSLSILGAAFWVAAQDDAPSERRFFEPVEVSVINLEVLVTDSKGRPVAGLTSDDFEVFEDGQPVEVSHFYAAPGVVSAGLNAPAISPKEEADQDLYLTIVLVDSNLGQANRKRSFDALSDFIPRLPGNTYVMVARCTGQLQILQAFTDDRGRLQSVLEQARTMGSTSLKGEEDRIRREMQTMADQNPPQGTSALPDDRRLRPLELSNPNEGSALSYVHHIKGYAASAAAQTEETMAHLRRLIRSLAGLHGRKAILVISDGIDVSPGADLFHDWEQTFSYIANATNVNPALEAQQFNLSKPVTETAESANADRVTVHAVTAQGKGLATTSGADRDGGVTVGSGLETEGRLKGGRADVLLAGATGGETLVIDRRLRRRMSALAEELGSYYSLGYRSPHGGDGNYHRIRVRVAVEGHTLRYREGYEDVRGSGRIADRTLTAAVLGLTENPLMVSVDYRDQEPRDDGFFLVPIVVRVPLSQLSLLPHPAEHEGKVSIIIAVRDEQGNLAEMERREYPIKIPHDQFLSALQENAEFIMGLLMRPGNQRVAVGVRDELGNVDSTLTVDIDVGEIKL